MPWIARCPEGRWKNSDAVAFRGHANNGGSVPCRFCLLLKFETRMSLE